MKFVKEELVSLTGLNHIAISYCFDFRKSKFKEIPSVQFVIHSLFILGAIVLIFLGFYYSLFVKEEMWGFFNPITFFGTSILFFVFSGSLKSKPSVGMYQYLCIALNRIPLEDIFKEIAKFNEVVDNLAILDQLKAAGNTIDITDRDKVVKALKVTKYDLTRALRTERILRENPTFKPEAFHIDITALRALQVTDQVGEYGRLFDDAMKIAMDVQETMRGISSS